MNEGEILKHLENIRKAAEWNIFSQQCFHEYIKEYYNKGTVPYSLPGVETSPYETSKITFESFLNELGKDTVIVKHSANSFITRNLLCESFRLVQSSDKLYDKMIKADWYHFVRIHVNAALHNSFYEFTNEDKKHLPVQYRDRIVTIDDNNKPYSLTLQYAFELVDKIFQFVKNEINS